MDLNLGGRVALVTGAGGRLGGAITKGLAAEGVRVGVHHRDGADRDQAAAVAEAVGGLLVRAELTDPGQVATMFATVEDRLGPAEICVANAGRFPRDAMAPVWEMDPEQWRQTVEDNLMTQFLTVREWAKRAVPRGFGSAVLLASAAGLFGQPGHADYAACKSAISGGFLLTLKNELGRAGPRLRANAVAPAWTADPEALQGLEDPIAATVATQAQAKIGLPADVASAVAWLASESASGHVSGHVLEVTGGMEGRLIHPANEA